MDSCTIVIFGASGDLTRRKLLPALYRLFEKKRISNCLLVGAAYDDTTAAALVQGAARFVPSADPTVWRRLEQSFFYQRLDFNTGADYEQLARYVAELEQKHGMSGNRLFYLATAAEFFCPITEYLASSGLATKKTVPERPWNRIAYEKPFGHDLKSAREINRCIQKYFDEAQIYRIDHFLTKELVGNIALIRFTNIVFEPLWNSTYIDSIDIVLSEELGIEGRGRYYDTYGALADVVQNHMLELLALITMEAPKKLSGDYIREQRAKILEQVHVVDGLLGQYKGYLQEQNVDTGSTTETFAALHLTIKDNRWKGVKFFLRTGKKLDKKETVIRVKFKTIDCLLKQEYCPSDSNYLVIRVAPEASFYLVLNAKKPGTSFEVAPVKMEFCHSCIFGESVPDAYETVFEEIIKGELATSVSLKEIEAAWKIIDMVKTMNLKLHPYEPGGKGPAEVQQFAKKYGGGWLL